MVGQGGMEQKLLEALYCTYFLIKKKRRRSKASARRKDGGEGFGGLKRKEKV